MRSGFQALAAAFAFALFTCDGQAITILSTFDADLDGWTSNTQGTVAFVSTGGNPSGYLQETDNNSAGNMHAAAPAKFLGNLTGFTTLSVDILIYATPENPPTSFAQLTFMNSLGTTFILDLGDPATTAWTHYSTALGAAVFGMTPAAYAALMSDVTSLTLILESDRNIDTERVGMDNFTISSDAGGGGAGESAVPEPATYALLGLGLTSFALVRRRTTR